MLTVEIPRGISTVFFSKEGLQMFKRMLFKLGTTACIFLAVVAFIKDSGIDQSLINAWNQFTHSEFFEKMITVSGTALDNYKNFAGVSLQDDVSGNE